MEFHEYANLFPMMTAEEMQMLRQNMRTHGFIPSMPILLYEGKILDGRNRYTAALAENIEPVYGDYQGEHALDFVVSANLHRRHLNETQRAGVVSKIANMKAGDNQHKVGTANLQYLPVSIPQAAKMLNVSPRTVATYKAVAAAMPELVEQMDNGTLTAHAAMKEVKAQVRKEYRAELASSVAVMEVSSRWNVYQADMQTWQAPRQYDFIITDPPYPKEYLYLYEVLAKRANEWLKPGGLLVAMCGQSYLDQIYDMMSAHLKYYWTACYFLPGQPTPLRNRQVNTTWKPLIMFVKDDYRGKIFGDVFKSDGNDKDFHKWGQSISGMKAIISQICLPGQSMLDPFCGAGTTGLAALEHGCLFDGVEQDEQNAKISRTRLAEYD